MFAWCVLAQTALLQGETYTERFSGPNPSWQVKAGDQAVRTVTHRRSPEHGYDGVGEQLAVESDRDRQTIRVEHALPAARVLNELEVAVWVRSNVPGVQVHLRIVLPEYQDPKTGRAAALLIPGDVVEDEGEWQRVICRTDDKLVQERLVRLRAVLKRTITPKRLIADRVILTWPLSAGRNELALDELTFGPLIAEDAASVTPAGHEQEATDQPPVQFRLDRLEVEGKPFFPRIVRYQGEPLKDLAAAKYNVVWMPDYTDRALLMSVRDAGMWATATPPVAQATEGEPGEVGLIPFTSETRSIAFWMLGTRVTPQSQSRVLPWIDQIQEADQKFRRPIAADVSGDEAVYSRELDLLGISRHTMGTSLTLRDYRNWLFARRSQARPGCLCLSWIQVAPTPTAATVWEQHQIPAQLEPEQIRLQVYAALAAGMRGLGFWTPRALSEENPADRETLLALRQINWELWLLEPWLATTNAVSRIPVTLDSQGTANKPEKTYRLRDYGINSLIRRSGERGRDGKAALDSAADQELTAAVLRTDAGTLLLPMWLENHAQYVPGPAGANQVSLIVPGNDETAVAWEISTTGIHSLDRERVSGGVKVTLKNFDQTAAILLTADRDWIEHARQRVAAIEEPSARAWLASAELKLERVRAVDQRLGELGLRQTEGPHQLGLARQLYVEAREALSQQQWHKVRLRSRQALQTVRALQRDHWDDAVRQLPAPVASPFALGFNSLPAQARLATQLNDAPTSQNLLPSGNFEDVQVPLTAVGWKHEQHAPETVRAEAQLSPDPHRGKYCLKLLASAAAKTQAVPSGKEFVSVTTPPITVYAGHVVRVSGWIKLAAAIPASQDGVMIYDSLLGRNLALRFREAGDWQRFELIREAAESQDATVTIALTGVGEVSLDDLEVSVLPLSPVQQASARGAPPKPRFSSPLNLRPEPRRNTPPRRLPVRSVP